jgi:hypothetical protein
MDLKEQKELLANTFDIAVKCDDMISRLKAILVLSEGPDAPYASQRAAIIREIEGFEDIKAHLKTRIEGVRDITK